eukprot:3252331-Lingulodinium_polyedra.AAC.1
MLAILPFLVVAPLVWALQPHLAMRALHCIFGRHTSRHMVPTLPSMPPTVATADATGFSSGFGSGCDMPELGTAWPC